MLKNRFFSVFAAAAMVSFAACQAEETAEVAEEPALEVPAAEVPATEPVVTETAPVVVDSAAVAPVEGAEVAPEAPAAH